MFLRCRFLSAHSTTTCATRSRYLKSKFPVSQNVFFFFNDYTILVTERVTSRTTRPSLFISVSKEPLVSSSHLLTRLGYTSPLFSVTPPGVITNNDAANSSCPLLMYPTVMSAPFCTDNFSISKGQKIFASLAGRPFRTGTRSCSPTSGI